MRKSKPKFSNLVMIAMILIAILYVYVDKKTNRITAYELSTELLTDFEKTENKYLNRKIELSGEVKSYYTFENNPNLLELKTNNINIKIFCSFSSSEYDSIAATLTYSSPVVINGIYRGIKEKNSPEEIYIDADELIINQQQ